MRSIRASLSRVSRAGDRLVLLRDAEDQPLLRPSRPAQLPAPAPPADAEDGADVVIVGRIRTLDPRQPDAAASSSGAASSRASRRPTPPSATPARGRSSSPSRRTASRCRASSSRTRTCARSGAASASSTCAARSRPRRRRRRSPRRPRTRARRRVDPRPRLEPDELGRRASWPNRMQLDQAAPGHPVALTRARRPRDVGQHAGCSSSRGSSRTMADPAGGEVMRDQSGEPTGILVDNAMDRVQSSSLAQSTRRRGAGRLPPRRRPRRSGTASRRSWTAARAPRSSFSSRRSTTRAR